MFTLLRWIGSKKPSAPNKHLLIGYRVSDFSELCSCTHIVKSAQIIIKKQFNKRHYVAAALPTHVQNVCPYVPDNQCSLGKLTSVFKRLLKKPPDIKYYKDQKNFVRNLLYNTVTPLEPHELMTYPEFRESIPHPEWRKLQLDEALEEYPKTSPKSHSSIKSFIKREMFLEPKIPRSINARCDKAKVKYGPMVKSIERKFYDELGYFAKHIPPIDRPRIIKERFSHFQHIYCSDYTAFESHMTPRMMRVNESQFIRYMMQYANPKLAKQYIRMLEGKNVPKSSALSVSVYGVRQSGEMSTSLSNGFTNMASIIYMLWRKLGRPNLSSEKFWNQFDLLIEGDDALIGYNGEFELTEADFSEVGLTSKIEKHRTIETTRFCQIAFQQDDMKPIADVRRSIQKIFFTMAQGFKGKLSKMLQFQQAKARSLLYEFPACPVVTSIGKALLRLSAGAEPIFEDNWKHKPSLTEIEKLIAENKFSMKSRIFVEQTQNISIQTQLEIEKLFDELKENRVLNLDKYNLFPPSVARDYCKFVENVPPGQQSLFN